MLLDQLLTAQWSAWWTLSERNSESHEQSCIVFCCATSMHSSVNRKDLRIESAICCVQAARYYKGFKTFRSSSYGIKALKLPMSFLPQQQNTFSALHNLQTLASPTSENSLSQCAASLKKPTVNFFEHRGTFEEISALQISFAAGVQCITGNRTGLGRLGLQLRRKRLNITEFVCLILQSAVIMWSVPS